MANAKDHQPGKSGMLVGCLGLWGSGKSTFCKSALSWAAREGRPRHLGILLSSELDTYAGVDVEYEVFGDEQWRPQADEWVADGYQLLMEWLEGLRDMEGGVLVLDPGTEASQLAMHAMLASSRSDDPKSLEYGQAYTGHDRLLRHLMGELLRIAQKNYVLFTGHVKMQELEGAGEATKQNVMGKQELRFEERQLPNMLSSFRQELGKYFSLWLYTYTQGVGPQTKYFLRAVQSQTAPAKSRVQLAVPNLARIESEWETVLEAING